MLETKIRNDKTGVFALMNTLVRNDAKHILLYPRGAILPNYD
jgi:hypothetical protein